MKKIRKKIDRADRTLITALSLRFRAVKKLGKIKHQLGLSVVQKDRWNQVMKERLKLSRKLGLRDSVIKKIMKIIHDEAVQIQKRQKKK